MRILIYFSFFLTSYAIKLSYLKEIKINFIKAIATTGAIILVSPLNAVGGMLTFPLPAPLKNNFVLVRAGQSFADKRHEMETNPVKKLRQDNALTMVGRDQAKNAAKALKEMGFNPTFIWASNTERAYETAAVIAAECQLGQNRIVPEYSFLDARAVGAFEGGSDEAWDKIHEEDMKEGINYRPPPNSDGTPSDSVSDVLVRANQLVSTIESMYSGENVVIVSPDSEVLTVLTAALSDADPDVALRKHFENRFNNGEVRVLHPFVKEPELLYTGQSKAQADENNRQVQYLRAVGGRTNIRAPASNWLDLWRLAVDLNS